MNEPAKAVLNIEGGGKIPCLFNPSELTVSKSNSWNSGQSKGRNAPELRFQGGQSATLSLSLTFDTTVDGKDTGKDVTVHTGKLLDLLKSNPNLPGADPARNSGRPPWVQFQWGKLTSFRAIVEKLQLKFTYFASDGTPLRAKADLSLKQWKDEAELPLQNPTSSTPSVHTVHTLLPGETLDRVAALHYQDATRWRVIAEANGIIDPLDIPPGTALVLPEPGTRYRA
jgi:nucleoid-associated protein YgaU